jgi:hypothetical protein
VIDLKSGVSPPWPGCCRLSAPGCTYPAPAAGRTLLASLLQAFYGIRSERLLLEQLNDNLLFRWFVGLSPDDPIWHPITITKNLMKQPGPVR